ncbi:MAG: hypothetical protein ACO1OB_31330 [Archangium sp.]
MLSIVLAAVIAAPDAGVPPVLDELRRLAAKVETDKTEPWVKQWLAAVKTLKPVTPATWHCSEDKQRCSPTPGEGLVAREVNDEFVYARITDPLGYTRPYEILSSVGFQPKGKKVLDFGYGNLGQLLMLASLGAKVHGVEVDRLLVDGTKAVARPLVLHHGYFPGDEKLVKEIGTGFDLWISKNTLKRGYVKPLEGKASIDVGPAPLNVISKELKKGGFLLIYNLAPMQKTPYLPMADGASPFTKEELQSAGFEILAFDKDDSEKAREMGKALEWGDEPLAATYTLARKR